MTVVKLAALVVAGSLSVGGGLLWMGRDTTVSVNCGPTVNEPAIATAFKVSDKITGTFNAVASGQVGLDEVAAAWFDTREMGELLAQYTVSGGRETPDAAADKIKADIATQTTAGLAACCPTVATAPTTPEATPEAPSLASLAGASGKVLPDGPDLAAAALRAAAPNDAKWLSQIPLGVAIAKYESSFVHDKANYVLGGHVGYWQISGPNAATLKLGDRTDVYVNARYAYALWKGRGGTWAKDWTTNTTATSHASEYAKYADAAAAPSTTSQGQTPTQVTPTGFGCPSSGTAGGAGVAGDMPALRVATWNTYCGAVNAAGVHCGEGRLAERVARVLGGMTDIAKQADIINTQEMSSAELRDRVLHGLDGFSIAGNKTSHPVFVRDSACKIVSDKSDLVFTRGTNMEGPDQGDRSVNTVDLNCGGKAVRDVNFHELPQIQKGGGLNKNWPKRTGIATKIYSTAMASAQQGAVQGASVVACDCNYDGDLGGLAAKAGLTRAATVFGNPKQATRTRNIDQIMWSEGNATGEKVLPAHGSDHSPRVVTFAAPPVTAAPATSSGGGGAVPANFNQQGNPRTVEEAIAWMNEAVPDGGHGYSVAGHCEGWMTRAYGNPGGYASATAHWNASGPRHVGATTDVPRGALIFASTSNPNGHVYLSLGGGQVMSTDWDGTNYAVGKIGVGPASSMFGKMLGWRAPNFKVGSEKA